MRREKLPKPRQDGHLGGSSDTCQTYLAEDWTMSDDVGYMGNELDWACGSGPTGSSMNKGSNWMNWTSMIVGMLALGTALYAAFAPRPLVERTQQKVSGALTRTAREAKQKAQQVMEEVSAGIPGSSAGAGMGDLSSSSTGGNNSRH